MFCVVPCAGACCTLHAYLALSFASTRFVEDACVHGVLHGVVRSCVF
jgi:hypothetical protein